jgi:hypothetical protein
MARLPPSVELHCCIRSLHSFIVGHTGTSLSQKVTLKQASELTTGLGRQHMHDCGAIARLAIGREMNATMSGEEM